MKQVKDRRGFSLTISVVFVLVAVMLTMVLVTAALSTMAQVKRNKDNKQANLTVTSTASVFAGTIEKMKWTVKPPDVPGGSTGGAGVAEPTESPLKNVTEDKFIVTDTGNSDFDNLAKALGELILQANQPNGPVPENYVVKDLVLKESHENSPVLDAVMTVYGLDSEVYPGDIVVTLCMQPSGGSTAVSDNHITFRIDGQCNYNGLTNGEYYFGEVTYYSGDKVYE